jgi:drug/metabolite transporter (DMT)-like permease
VEASVGARREIRPMLGIVYMLGGTFTLTLSDAGAKWLTEGYPPGQIISLRAMVICLVLCIYLLAGPGLRALRPHRIGGLLGRGTLACASTLLYISGLQHIPLADAIAIGFAAPMFLTAMAGPVLGESVGWRRWSAVVLGFLGVLLVLRPGSDSFQPAGLLIVLASLCAATRDVHTRQLSRSESTLCILFFSNLVMIAGGGLSLVGGWELPDLTDALVLVAVALLLGAGHTMHIEAFRLAQVSFIAPFKYSSLLWGVAFGVVFFGQLPDVHVWLGASVIVACGLYIAHRERQRQRRRGVAA